MTAPANVLLITLDQFRGDALSCASHPLVKTPHLDALASAGVRFARHYTQSTPCAPGRAGLYTGMYQMNHRVVANGLHLTIALTMWHAWHNDLDDKVHFSVTPINLLIRASPCVPMIHGCKHMKGYCPASPGNLI